MRVLIVVHGFPPANQGGSEIHAEAHARTLRRCHGDDVCVLTREQNPEAVEYQVREEHRDGLTIVWINNTFKSVRSFEETYANPVIAAIAAKCIDEFKPDLAHVHHLTCLSTTIVHALAERGIPTFFTLHDYWLLCHRGQLLDCDYQVCQGPEPLGCDRCLGTAAGVGAAGFAAAATLRALERRVPIAKPLRAAAGQLAGLVARSSESRAEARRRLDHMRGVAAHVTHFLAPSEHIRQRFIEFGVAPGGVTLAPYGFDHRPFQNLRRTESRTLRLGFLGSVMVSKAPHLLLEAFQRLPPDAASVDLFGGHTPYHGDDSYRERITPLLRQPGVALHGAVPHEQVPAALAAIDVLVVPSIWPENSPLVIREAFLAGVPVVASRIGGIPECVADGVNGLLFRPGDVDDLHGALLRLLNEPELLRSLRSHVPAVRTIEDDVAFARGLYGGSRPVAPPRAPRLAAIVLNYRTPDETRLAVLSLRASRRTIDELIVVDNDTTGACQASLADVLEGITYLEAGSNLGFSGGMNMGIRAALAKGADACVLVNSDVIVPPDCVGVLEAAVAATRGAGIAGPLILARTDPDRVASRGLSYAPATGRMRHMGFGERMDLDQAPTITEVSAASGCVMFVTRAVVDAIGPLGEDYFFSFEDLDYCLRAGRAGFRTLLASGAVVYHEGGRSMGGDSPRRLYFAARNHLLAAHRADPSASRLTRWRRGTTIVALNLAHAARSRGGTLASRLGAVVRGTRDYAAGRFGNK